MTGSKKNLPNCWEKIGKQKLVSKGDTLSVKRQCELLDLNRTSIYYVPKIPTKKQKEDKEFIQSRLDFWHTKQCCLGSRGLRAKLRKEDNLIVGRKLIKTYMDEMGIYAVYPKPNLSKRNKQHKIYPYLLRNMPILFSNQVWAIDITYIKMGKSHMYLTAIIDWYSRYIVGWTLSDSLDTAPVLETVKVQLQYMELLPLLIVTKVSNLQVKNIQIF